MFTRKQLYSNNRPMNRGLFLDVVESQYNIMTLEPKEGSDLPVLRELYLHYCKQDPTEYTLASEVFGSWEYWEQLAHSVDIKPYVERWRKEIVMYFKSRAVQSISKEAEFGKNKFQSAKWLYENGFSEEKPKKETKKSVDKESRIDKIIASDLARLRKKEDKDGNPAYNQ